MIKVYKLTTQDNKTRKGEYNECTWGPGVTHSGTGEGGLCGPGYIHAYLSPALAVLLNPIHANIPNPRLWECSVSAIDCTDKDLKIGSTSLTTVREVPLPDMTIRHQVIFAILCAEKTQQATKHLTSGTLPWQIKYNEKMSIFNEWASEYKQGKAMAVNAANAANAAYAASAASAVNAANAASAAASAAYAAASAAPQGLNLVAIAEEALSYI